MPKKRLFGFISDPLTHFKPLMDNTLCYMKEVQRLGHDFLVCQPKDLFMKQNELWGTFTEIELTGKIPDFFSVIGQKKLPLKKFDALFLRKDPPVDMYYLHHLYLLMKLEGEVLMVNKPSAILRFNEKLSALSFPFSPKTLVSFNADQIVEWAKKQKRGVVVKPLSDGSGRGVIKIKKSKVKNQNSGKILKEMTGDGRFMVVCQEFLPQISVGDQRIVLWNGKILTHFIRKPKPGNFLANTAAGGQLLPFPLGAREKKIAETVGAWAKKEGLYIVGLDVIRPYLTEINVTSPAGVQQGNSVYGKQFERIIINDVLKWI